MRASSATPPVGPFNQDSQLVSLSKSLARERVVASAADYIFAPTPHGLGDLRRVREALQRQMLAVVGELAEALAPAEPSIASRRDSLQEIARQLSDLELNAALLDDDLVAADDDRRVEFEEQRFELARRTLALRRRLDSEQRELVVVVDRIRGAALPDTAPLYGELDEMITRVRALDVSRG